MTVFDAHLHHHIALAQVVRGVLGSEVAKTAEFLVFALQAGHKVLLCGNGGSAADAQHIAAELTGRYEVRQRRALPALALSTDSSAVTAISNDFGFEQVFARQVEAHGQPGDVLIGISTSGHSINVIKAVERARQLGLKTIGLLGNDGGDLLNKVDVAMVVPAQKTAHIQEMHILIGHVLCAIVDQVFRVDLE